MGAVFAADLLARHPYTVKTDALHYVGLHESPAAHISLRAIDYDRFTIVNEVMLYFWHSTQSMAKCLPVISNVATSNASPQICGQLVVLGMIAIELIMLGRMQAAGGEILEEIEESKAFWEVYDGAVYMFQVRCRLMGAITAHSLQFVCSGGIGGTICRLPGMRPCA